MTSENESVCPPLNLEKCSLVLVDVAGTTTSIGFVKDTLLPYVERQVEAFLKDKWEEKSVKECLESMKEDAELDLPGAVERVKKLTNEDSSNKGLKTLQGLIYEDGYEKGDIKAHIFEDVPECFESWSKTRRVAVYSTGSVQAQKLLFAHTIHGDLSAHIQNYFDQTSGPKTEAESYKAIAKSVEIAPEEIVFITDDLKEATAAKSGGLTAVLIKREGNAALPDGAEKEFVVISSFKDLGLDRVTKRKIEEETAEEAPPTKVAKTDATESSESQPTEEKVEKKEESMEVDLPSEKVEEKSQETEKSDKIESGPEKNEKSEKTETETEENGDAEMKEEESKKEKPTEEKMETVVEEAEKKDNAQTDKAQEEVKKEETKTETEEKIESEEVAKEETAPTTEEKPKTEEEKTKTDEKVDTKTDEKVDTKTDEKVSETKTEPSTAEAKKEEPKEEVKVETVTEETKVTEEESKEVAQKTETTEETKTTQDKPEEKEESKVEPEKPEEKTATGEKPIENGEDKKEEAETSNKVEEKENKSVLANGVENGKDESEVNASAETAELKVDDEKNEETDVKVKKLEESAESKTVSVEV